MRRRRASWTVRGLSRTGFEFVLRLIGLVITGAWGAALGGWLASPSQTSLAGVVFGGVAVVFLGLLVRRQLRPGSRAHLIALRVRPRRGEWEAAARGTVHGRQSSSSAALGGPIFHEPSFDAHIYVAPGPAEAGPASADQPEHEWAAELPAEELTQAPGTSDAAAGETQELKGEVVAEEEKLGMEVEREAAPEQVPAAASAIVAPAAGRPQIVRRRRGGLIGRVGALASTASEITPLVALTQPQVERLRTIGRTASAIAVSVSESVRCVAADSRADGSAGERLADLVPKKAVLSPVIATRAAEIVRRRRDGAIHRVSALVSAASAISPNLALRQLETVAQVHGTDDAAISRHFEQLRATARAASATIASVSESIRGAVGDSSTDGSAAGHLDLDGRLAALLSVALRGARPAGFEPATFRSGERESSLPGTPAFAWVSGLFRMLGTRSDVGRFGAIWGESGQHWAANRAD
jgi:hypothetical protein